ncbi:MAG TPA: S1/P1 nuclease [Phycisphaerae bacterium]|nr:S1/P1 nuclease [Phycisphaerae bacterium]
MTRKTRIVGVAGILIGIAIVPSFGWGHIGHMVIAEIAWQHLNNQAKTAIRDILGSETLFYAATWPDRVRSLEEYDWIKPYHYVNVPKKQASYQHDQHCSEGDCVVGGIMANAKVLRDPNASKGEKKQAIRLLAHFVGDLHQPLHAGYKEDRGGNGIAVRFFGRQYINEAKGWLVNLHNVWDDLIIERRMQLLGDLAWEDYAQALSGEISDGQQQTWTTPTTNSIFAWTDTSYQLARVHAYRDAASSGAASPSTRVRENDDLREAYYDQALPIVERRLKEGGIRLAAVLNAIFSNQDPLPFGLETQSPAGMLPPTAAVADTIRIATFNIQVFGKTKAGKPQIMNVLTEIIRAYDLVAVQEIKDAQGQVPQKFLDSINGDGSQYAMIVSPRTGLQDDDGDSQEQYGFYYNSTTIEPVGSPRLFNDSAADSFQREPFMARFRAKSGNLSVVLISIHTAPEQAVAEIEALHDVVEWAQMAYPDEDDFVVLGDFNASCNYASVAHLNPLAIRGDDYRWVVPDDADTNIAAAPCAYDRIVVTQGAFGDLTGNWGVDRAFTDKKVSDHWPVWVEFFVGRDQH